MLTSFPTPVLSIAADAVRDLEGRDALSGLWTLFTKCKESLQDGRRLENISWRLWYRDMMRDDFQTRLYHQKDPSLYRPPTPTDSESTPPLDGSSLTYPQDHSPTHHIIFRSISIPDPAPYPSLDSTSASLHMSKPESKPHTAVSPLLPVSSPSHHRPPSVCVGRIIYDITSVNELSSTRSLVTDPSTKAPTTSPKSRYTSLHAAPPSPSLSDSYACAHPGEVDTTRLTVGDDVGLGPSLSVSASSPTAPQILAHPHTPGLLPNPQLPPRLVVVNPTPNLTPHPTPPASPSALATSHLNGFGGHWLTLPPIQDKPKPPIDRLSEASVTATDNFFSPLQPPPPSHQSEKQVQLPPPSSTFTSTMDVITTATIPNGLPLEAPLDVDAHPMPENRDGPCLRARLDSLSTIHSMSVKKGGSEDDDDESAVLTENSDVEDELREEKGEGCSTRLTNVRTAATRKKRLGIMKKVKTKTKPLKRNSLRSPTSLTFSPPPTPGVPSSSTNQKQTPALHPPPPIARCTSNGRSSSRSMSQSERSSAGGIVFGVRTNSRSRSRENREIEKFHAATRAASGERKKLVISLSTKSKNRSKFALGSKGRCSSNGKIVGEGGESTIVKKESCEARVEESGGDNGRELSLPAVDPVVNGDGRERDQHMEAHQQVKTEKQLERQVIQKGEQAAQYQLQKQEKGKAREHPNPNRPTSKVNTNNVRPPSPAPVRNTNSKHSTHETLNLVSSALAAKVKHTLADPLLPGQHKRTIVLTSESEFEDTDDDGSWSSEEIGSEDEEDKGTEEREKQEQLLVQQYHQQQQQQQQRQLQQLLQARQQRPPSGQRPNPPNHHHHNHNTHAANRAQRPAQSRGHRHSSLQANNEVLMSQAAQEAQRQREMFAKKPVESFQNLTKIARTQSVGLLTQLMNPNPEIFPVGHPCRRGYSSSEIRGVGGGRGAIGGDRDRDRGFRPLQPLSDLKTTKTDNAHDNKRHEHPPASRPETMHRKSSSSSSAGGGHSRATTALSPPARTLSMQMSKSTAAMPVSSQVQAGNVSTNTSQAGGGGHGVAKAAVNGGYRPKGPPQDQELEDESGSDSGGGIQLSKSVAQEKLKALAERRGIVPYGNQPTTTINNGGAVNGVNQKKQLGDEDDVPHWAKVSQPRLPTRTRSQDQYPQPQAQNYNANRRSLNGFQLNQMIASTTNQPAPIPVGHPYNLPPPAPPSTPRTTRRLMLSTELSESLRRNLLWERQVSKVNLAPAVRRTASGGGSRHSLLGGIQPLTTAPNVVQLHPKGTVAQPNPGSPVRTKEEGGGGAKERRASGGALGGGHNRPGPSVYDESEREKRKRLQMARNRSWANDYHFVGW